MQVFGGAKAGRWGGSGGGISKNLNQQTFGCGETVPAAERTMNADHTHKRASRNNSARQYAMVKWQKAVACPQ